MLHHLGLQFLQRRILLEPRIDRISAGFNRPQERFGGFVAKYMGDRLAASPRGRRRASRSRRDGIGRCRFRSFALGHGIAPRKAGGLREATGKLITESGFFFAQRRNAPLERRDAFFKPAFEFLICQMICVVAPGN
jgi:hypothetical protein